MKLSKGINLIYGRNEDGKSTLLNFIINSFYGISKNKDGKEISDYEKYKPWKTDEFSGKLEYELDDENRYEVFRNFRIKNRGSEFFVEQTKIDEDLFKSTFLVGQNEIKLSNKNQNMLIQKISNLVGTGNDNVSYKMIMDRLNKKKLEEVGTQKSREKPINVLMRRMEELQNQKNELENYVDIKYEIEENKNKMARKIFELEKINLAAQEIKKANAIYEIENEKINLQENLEKENDLELEDLNEEKN